MMHDILSLSKTKVRTEGCGLWGINVDTFCFCVQFYGACSYSIFRAITHYFSLLSIFNGRGRQGIFKGTKTPKHIVQYAKEREHRIQTLSWNHERHSNPLRTTPHVFRSPRRILQTNHSKAMGVRCVQDEMVSRFRGGVCP